VVTPFLKLTVQFGEHTSGVVSYWSVHGSSLATESARDVILRVSRSPLRAASSASVVKLLA